MAKRPKAIEIPAMLREAVKSVDVSFLTGLRSEVMGFLNGGRSYNALIATTGLIVYVSTMAALYAMKMGYRHAYGLTNEIPWGILISTYIFFVVTSTGLCMVSSLGHVFGLKNFMPITKRAVFLSIVTILAGFMIIFFDIESPFRMAIYNVISPNLTANIWWMGTLYGGYAVFMIIEFILLLMEKYRFAKYAGLLGLLSGIAAHSNLGAIFGMLHGREYWYGPYLPIYFIASAMLSGCAAIIFFTYLGYKVNNEKMDKPMERSMEVMGKLCALLIAVIIFLTTWKILTALVGGPGKYETVMALLKGPYAVNFWVFEVMIGTVIPFVLLLHSKGKNLKMMFTASLLMIIGIFIMRYDMVVVGQIVPSYYEMGVKEYQNLLQYKPSFYEIMVVAGGMGLTVLSFLLGEKVFDGHKSEIH